MTEIETRHLKQMAVMRGFLNGRQYWHTARAMELVRNLETGCRKDGTTPKFHHQLSVTRLVATLLPHLLYPEDTLTAAFLHDVLEDHSDKWTRELLAGEFGPRVADAVWNLSKKCGGITKAPGMYYGELATCPIGSIVKLADRAHNLQTMHGVFTTEKQRQYSGEVEQWYFPMIRTARRRFPAQYGAYENLKIILRVQFSMVNRILEASQVGEIE